MKTLGNSKSNYGHSGAYVSSKAEKMGASIVPIEEYGFRIDKGNNSVYVPDRALLPSECRSVRALLKRIGILLAVTSFFLIIWVLL